MNRKAKNPFRNAMPFLWDGRGPVTSKPSNICAAIERAMRARRVDVSDVGVAYNMISGRLGDFSFASSWITDWLQKNGKPAPTSQQIQQWRHRWLIALAKEWDEGVRE